MHLDSSTNLQRDLQRVLPLFRAYVHSSYLQIFSSLPSHLHTFSSSHLLILTSFYLIMFTSSHLLIFTPSHLHIFSSSHLLSLALLPSFSLALLPSCHLAFLPSCSVGLLLSCPLALFPWQCQRGATKCNPFARNEVRSSKTEVNCDLTSTAATLLHEMRFDRQKLR